MRPAPEVHDALARLLTYPGEGGGELYPAAVEIVERSCPEAAGALLDFTTGIASSSSEELEELYTRTFDNVNDRALEVGWQLFGENYARGVLMVRLRALMREHGVTEHTELPDHLSHVLALLGRGPEELSAALARNQVHQAVEKMLAGLRTYGSPWVGVLEATLAVLEMHESPTSLATEVNQ